MPNSAPFPSFLSKINESPLSIKAVVMELTNWIEQHGAADVADNALGALVAIHRNEELIKMTLAVITAPE